MPSYIITGASRGLGFEFLDNISSNPSNTVIGLVRNVADAKAKIASWNRSNVHIIEGDLNNYDSLKKAVDAVSAITSGSLDYIIASAAYISKWSAGDPLSILGQDPSRLGNELIDHFNTNVVGNVHLFNLFMPLILKGNVKKVIALSTGMADTDLVVKSGVYEAGPYTISKAALYMAVAKFQVEWEKEGVLFMAISPGFVATEGYDEFDEEGLKKLAALGEKFKDYAPNFTGPSTPEQSVKDVLKVVENASLANGDAAAFLSHHGNKQWL